jgi:hypothetical protein
VCCANISTRDLLHELVECLTINLPLLPLLLERLDPLRLVVIILVDAVMRAVAVAGRELRALGRGGGPEFLRWFAASVALGELARELVVCGVASNGAPGT